jgi:hypothetical protein
MSLRFEKLAAIVHLVLDNHTNSFKSMLVVVQTVTESVRQCPEELQTTVKGFLAKTGPRFEVFQHHVVRRVRKRQLFLVAGLLPGTVGLDPVSNYHFARLIFLFKTFVEDSIVMLTASMRPTPYP